MKRVDKRNNHQYMFRHIIVIFAFIASLFVLSAFAFADNGENTVRVGYYENEVFQEGAEEGGCKDRICL